MSFSKNPIDGLLLVNKPAGMGCCALRHPALAEVVENAFLFHDGTRYDLLAWCVMPNHVHVLARPLAPLPRITHAWKSFTRHWAMKNNTRPGLGIPGTNVWQREAWERHIRDEKHFNATLSYIHENPVKAGLCEKPEDWPWSSANPRKRNAGIAGGTPVLPDKAPIR